MPIGENEIVTIPALPDETFRRMVDLRRHFHRHPELSFEEVETARTVMAELDRLEIPCEYGGPGGGVVGRLVGTDVQGPTVALRAEMDALPCAEHTGLPFASEVPDRMHACGHDAHMAMVLGAAALLRSSPPAATTLFVFQPAEERGNGSLAMLRSGLLADATAIFAGHVTHHYALGELMVSRGTITARADRFTIRVRGRGGHGARPHEAIDAVVIAGILITTVQTLVSRTINPAFPAVVTIGSVRAGSAPNIIAEDAVLDGTIRTTRAEARQQIVDGLHRIANALAHLHSAEIAVTMGEWSPPVVNSERETAIARRAALRVVGREAVVEQEYPSMGAEDFSYYLHEIPGCYVRIGVRGADGEYVPLHSPRFDVDEQALKVGACFYERVVREAATSLAPAGAESAAETA